MRLDDRFVVRVTVTVVHFDDFDLADSPINISRCLRLFGGDVTTTTWRALALSSLLVMKEIATA